MKNKGLFFATIAALLMVLGQGRAVAQQRSAEQIRSIVENSPLKGKGLVSKSKAFGGGATAVQAEPYYVFEAGGGEGFVIVSGDERMAPVLGYSTSGDFDLASAPDNVRAWLQAYADEYRQLQASSASGATGSRSPVIAASGEVKGFLPSKWGQGTPYNALCPEYRTGVKAVTGCGATAMAQIMYYYGYPAVGKGSHSYTSATHGLSLSWNFATHPFQWSLMKDKYSSTGNTEDEVTAISELMYACGVAVDMDYDVESGSYHKDVMAALNKYFGYDEDMAIIKREYMAAADWHATLMDELDAKRPLLVSAHTVKNAGHMFLIHGYAVDTEDADHAPYYEVNWGWSGAYDGKFKMPNLNYDGNADNTLSEDISIIIGIKPDDGVKERSLSLQVKDVVPSATKLDVGEGDVLKAKVSGLLVGTIGDFVGTISLALVGADDNVYVVSTTPAWTLVSGGSYSYETDCTLPGSIPSGDYALKCFARASGTSEDVEVPIGSGAATVQILNDETAYTASMAASEVVVEEDGARGVKLSATNVMNLADIAFSGTLQILLTDYEGKKITTFGSTKTLSSLGKYSYFPRTDAFSGELPPSVADGAYRVCLGAQQSGYEQWGKVKKYVIAGGCITKTDLDASTPLWVVDGEVTLEAPHRLVTFKVGDEVISQQSLVVGDPITAPDAPEKEGYTFNGWDEVPAVVPMTDVVVTGSYTVNQYTVRFVADGEVVSEQKLDYGAPITAPTAPAKEGYTFADWGEVPATVPARNVEFVAQYSVNSYHLTYVVEGETVYETDIDYGAVLSRPKSPTKEGHTFTGWQGIVETMPAKDLICTAMFEVNQYTVRFVADGKVVSEQTLDYGTAITAPAAPEKEGYTFETWGEVPATVPAKDVELTARYKVNQYTITYLVDGEEYKSETLDFGATITPAAAPTKAGFKFSGWSAIPATMPARNITVTGTFADNPHMLTFKIDGEVYSTSVLSLGAAITVPDVEEKEGYTFSGWDDVAKTMPDADLEYEAHFTVNSYKLRYIVDGKLYRELTVEYGAEITPEGNPEDDDYYYAWEDVPATMPAHDVEVQAVITAVGGHVFAEGKVQVFSPSGQRRAALQKGVNIIRTADGRTLKVTVR